MNHPFDGRQTVEFGGFVFEKIESNSDFPQFTLYESEGGFFLGITVVIDGIFSTADDWRESQVIQISERLIKYPHFYPSTREGLKAFEQHLLTNPMEVTS